jgi:hypothetical protein
VTARSFLSGSFLNGGVTKEGALAFHALQRGGYTFICACTSDDEAAAPSFLEDLCGAWQACLQQGDQLPLLRYDALFSPHIKHLMVRTHHATHSLSGVLEVDCSASLGVGSAGVEQRSRYSTPQ